MAVYRGKRPVAEWSNQEIFDYVANHLLTQNEQSVTVYSVSTMESLTKRPDGYDKIKCNYRSRKGNKRLSCAIGCLIPNKLYNEDMEGKSVVGIIEKYDSISKYLIGDNAPINKIELLSALQDVHDLWKANHSDWKSSLNKVAAKFRLKKIK